jgi:cytochrome b561
MSTMAAMSTTVRYGNVAQFFHWMTAILVVVAFVYGPGGPEQRVYAPARDFERQLHETLGFAVLALALLRLGWRAVDRTPAEPPSPLWMRQTSKAVQASIYVLLFAVPLTAICGAWLAGHPLTLLGGMHIDPWLAEAHDVGRTIATLHGWLGDAILWVAGAHAAAALFHHFVLRDQVLRSMLPG